VVAAGAGNDNYRYPASRMPFDLKDPHFMVCAFKITSAGTVGTLMAAQEIMGSQHSALQVLGDGFVWARMVDSAGLTAGIGMAQPALNALCVATLAHSGGATPQVRLRVDGAGSSFSSTASMVASPYGTLSLGMGYWDYYPQDAIQGLEYAWIAGKGAITDAELAIVETYAKSFGQVPAAPPSGADALIQAQFTAGNAGYWGGRLTDFAQLQEAYGGAAPTSWTALAAVWKNKGNLANGHDLAQTDNTLRGQLGTDGSGRHFLNITNATPLVNVGASTTSFYFCMAAAIIAPSYDCVLLTDSDAANKGVKIEQEAFAQIITAKFGTGAATVTVQASYTALVGTANNSPLGLAVIDGWHDGTNVEIRVNKIDPGAAGKSACAAISAGNVNMLLGGGYPLSSGFGTSNATLNLYDPLVFKNYCPSAADRDAIASDFGAAIGLTI
jgi:hypothetical protein